MKREGGRKMENCDIKIIEKGRIYEIEDIAN